MMDDALDRILPQVEKPGRYIGGEWNAVVKDAETVALRVCLVFPDLYELGLGNLGLQILYATLNAMEKVWAQRVYLPGPDMEAQLRENSVPLYMLESRQPVASANAIGITLQSELTYVNVLKIIDLAGLPLRSAARDGEMPWVFAGGPGAYNPEPLAPFIDFFVVGDGEEAVVEIAQCLMRHQGAPRSRTLEALASMPGVYVPALHPLEELPDGRRLPRHSVTPVESRIVPSLDSARYPTRMITPFVQMIHDGVGIETLRGCTHGCRFCQAGMINRPVREREVATILELLEGAATGTGMEDATLVSLSTCDYSRVRELLRSVAEHAHARNIAVALPSLRLDRFSVELADYIAPVRRSGLTFAPEAGSARLRAVINKEVSDEQLIALAEEAFRRGWRHIKTYFMIGLPTETDADVDAIADLCLRVYETGRRIRSNAMIHTGVSTFVPKPFTPFQWAAQLDIDETRARQRRLADQLRSCRGVKFGRHAPETSFIEGLLSRADRRAADLLEAVWLLGGGYETWEEKVNLDVWHAAIEETGYDVSGVFAERADHERFPWDHIQAPVRREALLAEWRRAHSGEYTPDCREGICHQCGAMERAGEACRVMRERAADGRASEITLEPREDALAASREVKQRVRFRVGRIGRVRFLSHLETADAWIRALRRADAPLAYSQGFHAHPKVTFAAALPVGEESEDELMDVALVEEIKPETLLAALRAMLPDGLHAYEAWTVEVNAPALMAAQVGLGYYLFTSEAPETLRPRLEALQKEPVWDVERNVKSRASTREPRPGRKTITLDIRPLVVTLTLLPMDAPGACIHFVTRMRDKRLAKPREIMTLLGLDPLRTRARKTETRLQ